MNELQAKALAEIFSGEAWNSGGGIWLAAYWRGDGKFIVFSGDAVCEYEHEDDFDAAKASNALLLASGDETWWGVSDAHGRIIYRSANLKTGWRSQEEAEREARGFQSRTGDKFFAIELDRE